jgi:hypothetical protein
MPADTPITRLPRVTDVLGAEHPLSRNVEASRVVRRQAAVCAALLTGLLAGAYPALGGVGWFGVSAVVVDLALVLSLVALRDERHRRARELIIEQGPADLAELRAERRRLLASAHRNSLARQLEQALIKAQTWDDQLPASRPPPAVRHLLAHDAAVHAVVCGLREGHPSLRGIALVERLLDGRYGSSLYLNSATQLGEELRRIAFEFQTSPSQLPRDTRP